MKRYLITGIQGMVGSHLADYLVETRRGLVAGIARERPAALQNHSVQVYSMDMLDYEKVRRCLEEYRPDYIFHLAARTFIPESWNQPLDTFRNNTMAQMNLFQSVVDLRLDPVIHVSSSGAVYGNVPETAVPLREDHPLNPADPYGLSKATQEMIAKQYMNSYGVKTIITRTFNHTGPGRAPYYVESSFSKQLVEIEQGLRPAEIVAGDLSVQRDFLDVRDVVRAYVELIESNHFGETYQIGSGRPTSIGELLDILVRLTGLSVRVTSDPRLHRQSDLPILYGDSSKLQRAIAWQPCFPLERTLQDLLDYWREE